MSVAKKAKEKVEKAWTTTKKIFVFSCLWGLCFSLVTITSLGVAFDYDDVLVNSSAAYTKALTATQQAYSPDFWAVVNQSYDLEKPKLIMYPLAWIFRIFGFKVAILTARPAVESEALKKEWRHLVGRGQFMFGSAGETRHAHLAGGNFVMFFGDSDTDIQEARKARVYAVRVRRHPKSFAREDYHPGTLGEPVIPLSEY